MFLGQGSRPTGGESSVRAAPARRETGIIKEDGADLPRASTFMHPFEPTPRPPDDPQTERIPPAMPGDDDAALGGPPWQDQTLRASVSLRPWRPSPELAEVEPIEPVAPAPPTAKPATAAPRRLRSYLLPVAIFTLLVAGIVLGVPMLILSWRHA